MARAMGKLSALKVAKIAKPGMYSDGGGLYLQVTGDGKTNVSRSWIFQFKVHGRERQMGLGPLHTITLAEAREKALECRKLRLEGIDPIDARRAVRGQARLENAKSMTFKACTEAYFEAHRAGWRNAKHAAQWIKTLATYVYPVFGAMPVQAVDVALVTKVIEPIWTTKTETASRVRGRIESVLDWATARGYRRGDNPARWRGHLENLLPKRSKVAKVEHHAALPHGEIGAFMVRLRAQEGIAAQALQFTILTAARTGETIGASREEINEDATVWTVPAKRMKVDTKDHRVPLPPAAAAIVKKMLASGDSNFVFPGGKAKKPLSNTAMAKVLERMERTDITVHGFRSTFRDWAAENGFPGDVAEMALAHVVDDKVEAAYRRGDLLERRRPLMEAWAAYCAQPASAASAKVVPIRGGKSK